MSLDSCIFLGLTRANLFYRSHSHINRNSHSFPSISDRLFEHCTEIDEAAQNRMELIVPQLAKQYGVTERLKAENQMEWVRQMNACKAQAEEIVKAELIYD